MSGAITVTGRDPLELEVARQIRFHRIRLRLTQADLGALIGCSGFHISDLERCVNTPSLRTLGKLAEAFHVSPRRLLGC